LPPGSTPDVLFDPVPDTAVDHGSSVGTVEHFDVCEQRGRGDVQDRQKVENEFHGKIYYFLTNGFCMTGVTVNFSIQSGPNVSGWAT
jgi:hypothetical protein